ncbi:hypothetical protein LEP1GSC041_3908 [Leptospira noguchii str. 2006001870]|nr:hypothetical protein LEP1GSC041_3908 [Leptospira noguchii str. 2006001870]
MQLNQNIILYSFIIFLHLTIVYCEVGLTPRIRVKLPAETKSKFLD